nr:hypothetical protein [Tanacetum cinerariifolium]
MDRETWMYNIDRFTPDYVKGLSEFMKCAEAHRKRNLHGEIPPQVDNDTIVSDFNMDENFGNDDNHRDNLDEMLHDTKSNVDEKNVKKLQQMFDDAEKPLFEGSFHEDNELPVTTYHAKKLTCPIGLVVERIHACRNDCILYRKDYKDLHECLVCKASRYKHHKNLTELDSDVTKNGPPTKILSYLPIIPRLKKLYANPKDAKLLRWHAEERKKDGKIRHVADSPQWKNNDRDFKKFGFEIRNIRFGLCSDGVNPFKSLSSRHSTCLLGLLLNIPGKTKDGVNARKDMLAMGIRSELAAQETNGEKIYLPPACYTLSKAEKTSFCECLRGIKVPFGYSANIKNLVSMKDLKFLGMKSHDCHIAGPVFLRYMYPFERYMGFLKGYVRNRYRPEGSIIQGYAAKEVVQFCTNYIDDVTDIGLPQPRHQDKVIGMSPSNVDADVIQIGYRPRRVLKYQGFDINGYMFYTKKQDDKTKQVDQVFYVEDLLDKIWHIVLQSKRSIVAVDDVVDEDEYNKFDELPPFSIGFQSDAVLSDTIYLRSDHQEGQED